LLAALRLALPVDGVLLALQGALSAQGVDDADGDILAAVRELVGPHCPIMAVHDFHSNLSQTMVQKANALIVERTYPHTDTADRALDTARLIALTVRGEVRPIMSFRPLPLFWAAPQMITAVPPMKEAIDELDRVLQHPEVLTASISVGYEWADSPVVGASTLVVTNNDFKLARTLPNSMRAGFGTVGKAGRGSR
jgi:microcystin degradation protein MlrC